MRTRTGSHKNALLTKCSGTRPPAGEGRTDPPPSTPLSVKQVVKNELLEQIKKGLKRKYGEEEANAIVDTASKVANHRCGVHE